MNSSATILRNRMLNRARLRHLHVFVCVADLQSVKRAAEAVGITQPSATQAIADLEKLLEVALFLRHSHGMSLTPAGIALLPIARRALGLIDEAATQAAALAKGSKSVVRVAATSAAIGGHLERVIPAFARKHPDVLLNLQEANMAEQSPLLAANEVDCSLCRCPLVLPQGWLFTSLWQDRFAIVSSPRHPLNRKRNLQLDDLRSAKWLVTPTSVAAREVFDSLFENETTQVSTYNVVTASPTLVGGLISREELLALLPLSVVSPLIRSRQLVELKWPEVLSFGDLGVLAPESGIGQATEQFLEFLRCDAQKLLAKNIHPL